jgi:hypothetical protein
MLDATVKIMTAHNKAPKLGPLTKTLAITGTLLAWFPILAPVIISIVSFFIRSQMMEKTVMMEDGRIIEQPPFNFDFLMPAELFPFAFGGAALLLWAALRARSHRRFIGLSFLAMVVIPVIGQIIASVTGLASGETEPEGLPWILVLVSLGIYCLALVAVGIGGIMLLKRLFIKHD